MSGSYIRRLKPTTMNKNATCPLATLREREPIIRASGGKKQHLRSGIKSINVGKL